MEQIIVSIRSELLNILKQKWQIANQELSIERTSSQHKGDFTLTTYDLTKFFKLPPDQVAEKIGNAAVNDGEIFKSYEVKNGFLNFEIKDEYLISLLKNRIIDKKSAKETPKKEKVLIEFSSPNTNKPLHLGHLRNIFIGDSLSRIGKYLGHEVIRACVVNDRGIHICKSMLAYKILGNGETPSSQGIKGDKFVGEYYVKFENLNKNINEINPSEAFSQKKLTNDLTKMLIDWETGDKDTLDLWRKMNSWVYQGFDETYKKIGTTFDKIYYESDTYKLGKDIINQELENKKFIEKKDGTIFIDLSKEGLDEKILMRSDGTSVYITQDLGMADLRYNEYKSDKTIYVVGDEQNYHFKVLFLILKKINREYANSLHHLSYGMVTLPSGKMKSREGTTVDADDLIDTLIKKVKSQYELLSKEKISIIDTSTHEKVAIAALKYHLLKIDPKKEIMFDPEKSIALQGNTGPYILYSYVRIVSILNKILPEMKDTTLITKIKNIYLTSVEKNIIFHLDSFQTKILETYNSLSPNILANYLFDLAKYFNQFYADHNIIKEKEKEVRSVKTRLILEIADTIKTGMGLLGIEIVDKM